jgi:hypothetical protein
LDNLKIGIAVFVSALMFGNFATTKSCFSSDNVAELGFHGSTTQFPVIKQAARSVQFCAKLTPWSSALLERPPVVQLLKDAAHFYGIRKFITVFTRALH